MKPRFFLLDSGSESCLDSSLNSSSFVLDPDKPREEAIEEAVERMNRALEGRVASSPLTERIQRIRDVIVEHSRPKNLVSLTYLENKLGFTPYQAKYTVSRALQLYPDVKEVRLFNALSFQEYCLSRVAISEKTIKIVDQLISNYFISDF